MFSASQSTKHPVGHFLNEYVIYLYWESSAKARRYAQGELLVAMSPHIGRDTQNIAHSRLGKQSLLFRTEDRNAKVGIHVLWRVMECSADVLCALKVAVPLQ